MDIAVALVQSYLHINGYFTVAEYPVLEARKPSATRTVTDLDIMGFRFMQAGHHGVGIVHPSPPSVRRPEAGP